MLNDAKTPAMPVYYDVPVHLVRTIVDEIIPTVFEYMDQAEIHFVFVYFVNSHKLNLFLTIIFSVFDTIQYVIKPK